MGTVTVPRHKMTLAERLYLPAIWAGMRLTFRRMFRPSVTIQYPEQTHDFLANYRGAPGLVRDEDGREKCVACQLCEFICPPKAIQIVPGEIEDADHSRSHVEREPKAFEIDMLRCIYCGYCEEICPEQAIFMTDEYRLTGSEREDFVYDKDRLYELGGTMKGLPKKWEGK